MPTYHPIIALAGYSYSGKDTTAAILQDVYGAVPIAFADALRKEIASGYNLEVPLLEARDTKDHPMSCLALKHCLDEHFVADMRDWHLYKLGTPIDMNAPRSPRQITQWWGTEYRRKQNPDYWLPPVDMRMATEREVRAQELFVLTDVRFFNEATFARAKGGVLGRMHRPGCAPAIQPHVSNTSGNLFDPEFVLDNSRDLEHLRRNTLAIAARFGWNGFVAEAVAA